MPITCWFGSPDTTARYSWRVTDDGRGIDLTRVRDAGKRGHVGLASCRERVQGAGGRMELEARPSGGTCVLVSLPAHAPSNGGGRS